MPVFLQPSKGARSWGKGCCHVNPCWYYICVLFNNMCIFRVEYVCVSSMDYNFFPSKDQRCVLSDDYICVQFHNCVCPISGLCLCLSTVISPLQWGVTTLGCGSTFCISLEYFCFFYTSLTKYPFCILAHRAKPMAQIIQRHLNKHS